MSDTDLRTTRTKQSLRQAFYELLREKDFNKITVREITDRAGINRVTFYLHYQDKYDFMDKLIDELVEEAKRNAALVTPEIVQTCREQGQPFPHLLNVLEYVEQNQSLFRYLAQSDTGELVCQRIYRELNNETGPALGQLIPNNSLAVYGPAIATSLFGSITKVWMQRGMPEPKEEIALMITRAILALLDIS